MHDYADLFGAEGPLAAAIPGFATREEQIAMAEQVALALHAHGRLIVEAGTGTGKTFAYLVPALLSGRRVIVSTGTRNLQDQLFHRDLPTVARAIGRPVRVALLKGRANYLCLHRLELAEQQAPAQGSRARTGEGARVDAYDAAGRYRGARAAQRFRPGVAVGDLDA
jgi:ATP-dependent DNA helicase DinG